MEYKNYVIEPTSTGRYNLYKKHTGHKLETKEEFETKTYIAYSIPFIRCLFYLLTYTADEQEKTTIRGYIDEFSAELEKIKKVKYEEIS